MSSTILGAKGTTVNVIKGFPNEGAYILSRKIVNRTRVVILDDGNFPGSFGPRSSAFCLYDADSCIWSDPARMF